MLNALERTVYTADHHAYRETVRRVFAKHLIPNLDRFEEQGLVDREFWLACGEAGMLCPQVSPEYGGLGLDYGYNAILAEELSYAGSSAAIRSQSMITVDYIERYAPEHLKKKYLPLMISGECITAIAMTEPDAGSDLQSIRTTALRDGDEYVINGTKTYITSGECADIVIVVVKTDPSLGAKGTSLVLVEADRPGFRRGRKLGKIGLRSSDTTELFFENVRVPVANLMGEEGRGFYCLVNQLPQERLSIAIGAQASAQRAFDEAVSFTKDRKAFGKTVFDFQNTRFTLASMKSQLQVGWAHVDWALSRHMAGTLTTAEASAAKLWHTEMQGQVVDGALQLHGGAGYINETAIARLWRDARVTRIYGGSSEIMKEVISRAI